MSEINFPGSAVDGSTFFHGDNVCVYHAADNTWECRAVVDETAQPPNTNVYITSKKVYTLGDKRADWQNQLSAPLRPLIGPVPTQEEVNQVIINLLEYIHENSGSAATVDYATEEWVAANYAPLNHTHADDGGSVDHPTRAEFDTLVAVVSGNFATLMSAITGS